MLDLLDILLLDILLLLHLFLLLCIALLPIAPLCRFGHILILIFTLLIIALLNLKAMQSGFLLKKHGVPSIIYTTAKYQARRS